MPEEKTVGTDLQACFACGDQRCSTEAATCDDTAGCRDLLDCVFGCDGTDGACQLGCVPSGGQNSPAATSALQFYSCTIVQCLNECVVGVDASIGGSGGFDGTGDAMTAGGASTGGAMATGGALATGGFGGAGTGGAGTGGAGTGGAGTGGIGTGGGGSGGTDSAITWLSIDGDWVDPSVPPNDELNISGAIYSYGDGCATITWDPVSRCASGTLCEPGPTFANWGMSIGFDFHNTGESGTPANTKLAWNADSVGAVGVAWRVSGSAPGLQVWITNMAPSWGGQCMAEECAIDGPPDGTRSTPLDTVGQLNFDSMIKDDWGGSGTNYTFSRSNILALQFKLASVVSGATSFDFCIDQIGIIR